MTLEEAIICSRDWGNYPKQFTSEMGLDLKLEHHPDIYVKPSNEPRNICIKISSFRGYCWGAKHYYVKILADGLMLYQDEINKDGSITTYSISRCINKEIPSDIRDLYSYKYEIWVTRFVTQEEIDEDESRWDGYDTDDTTDAFYTPEEAEKQAREIIAARFIGNWKVTVEHDY